MAMTPEEKQKLNFLEKMVISMVRGENVEMLKNIERRITFPVLSLSDLSDVSETAPSNGQVLKYNGTEWAPGTDIDT
jgi:hypothetical protein